jgi:hypothetical protein
MDREEFDDIIIYCLNKFFKGMEFKLGSHINVKIKSVVQKLELEDGFLKDQGILFELENKTYFRLMFETKHRNIEFINQVVIDTRLYNLEDKKIYAVIINTSDANPESCRINLGTIKYEPETIRLNGNKSEVLIDGLKRKIYMEEQFDDQDKINLILYPLMDKSEFILERTLKIIDLVKDIKNEEQRIIFLGAIAGVAEQYSNKEEVQRFKEALIMTEIGCLLKQVGIIEGIKECIFTILLNKFETIPEVIYGKIEAEKDESILREWLSKAINYKSIKDLEVN